MKLNSSRIIKVMSGVNVKIRLIVLILFSQLLIVSCLENQSSKNQTSDVDNPLIPRKAFFDTSGQLRVRISPDGKWYSYVEAKENSDFTIKRQSIQNPDQIEILLDDGSQRFPEYHWSYDTKTIFFLRDTNGAEDVQLHTIDLESKEVRNITNDPKVRTRLIRGSEKNNPETIIVGFNNRDPRFFDAWKVNLKTGEKELIWENDQEFIGFSSDDEFKVRFGVRYASDASFDCFIRESGSTNDWKLLFKVQFDDLASFDIAEIDWENDLIYIKESGSSDKAVLSVYNMKTSELTQLISHSKADVTDVIFSNDKEPLFAMAEYVYPEYIGINDDINSEIDQIQNLYPEAKSWKIMSRTNDDKRWLIAFFNDQKSIHYYLWDREVKTGLLAFVMKPHLDQLSLVPMHGAVIPTRDGLELVSYLSLPHNHKCNVESLSCTKSLPMVLYVHGGPFGVRDSWGFHDIHQWLANRGYAVLSVNYRGSGGFGKAFQNAGYGEWGGKMHDDLIDAVNWAKERGIADPERIAIMGASYGGYATLAGLTMTPDVFAAGVDTVGVANLVTLQQQTQPVWKPFKAASIKRVGGDAETEEGRKFLLSRSPISYVDNIQRPLLVGHGDNDVRVTLIEAQQIVDAMLEKNLPVTLIRFPDEGHGFVRPSNTQSYYGVVEIFLKQNLGGRAEPIKLESGTTIHVPTGAEHIPGLQKAIDQSNQ